MEELNTVERATKTKIDIRTNLKSNFKNKKTTKKEWASCMVYVKNITYHNIYFIHPGGKSKLSFDLMVKHNQKSNCTYIAS